VPDRFRRRAWITEEEDVAWSSTRPTKDVICNDEEHGLVFTGILDANGDPIYRDTIPERVEFGFHYYPPNKRRRRRK
jgi:hypothetical protein